MEPGSVDNPAGKFMGPRQQAQQLKKQRFNKVCSDLACKKAFFMTFVRHPCYDSADKVKALLNSLTEIMKTQEHKAMVRDSADKNAEETEQKRQCHQARLAFKRGKLDHENNVESKLAHKYAAGELEKQVLKAEAVSTRKKHLGVARRD